MLTPDYLDMIPDSLDALFQELDEWIIKDYARRVAKAGEVTETAQGMAENAELLGLSETELKKETARILKLTREQLEAIFGDTAFISAKNDADRFRSAGLSADRILKNRFLRKYIEAAYKQTYGNFKNITGTLGVAVGDNFENLTDYYRNRLDFVQLQVSSGVISHDAAVREAVKNIASKGIMHIDYESGRRLNIASAARMCTLTGVNQMARQLNEGICDELGLDLVEVTAHEGARPTHKEWQGKIFSRSGKSKKYPDLVKSTGLGTVEGLCGAYCRHNYYGYVEGSPRAWTDDDLANIDPQPFDYNGKSYSFYEASQRMRYMERQIRKTKREIVGYEAAGLESDFVAASIRLNRQKQEYKKFAKASGVRPRLERTQEFAYGRSVSQKAVHKSKEISRHLAIRNGKLYGISTIGSENISKDTLKMVDTSLHKIFKAHPEMQTFINNIKFDDNLNDIEIAKATISSKLIVTLKINKRLVTSKEALDRLLKECPGMFTPKNSFYDYLEHEFTHFREWKYAIEENTKDGIIDIDNAWLDISMDKFSKEIIEEACKSCMLPNRSDILEKEISLYGSGMYSEAVAEAMSGGRTKLCKKIKELVKKRWK